MKKIIIILTVLFSVMFNIISANAQVKSGKEALCERDWSTFISATISYDGFVEYWKDIFYRYNKNICYYMDIDNILKKLEKAREQIRNAFLTCASTRAQSLAKTYYKLEAELYFLRNFVDLGNSKLIKVADEKVYQGFRDNFYINKSYFTEEEVLNLFKEFKAKYGDRISKTYAECQDPGIKMIKDKWNSLVTNFKSMGGTGKAIKDHWDKSLNAPVQRTGQFLGGVLDVRLNGLPVKKGIDQIYNEIKKKMPITSAPTVIELQNKTAVESETYATKTDKATLMAEYEALYKNGSDTMSKDFENKVKELNEILKNTYKPIENMTDCTKATKDRQCK
ncbi:hypothetical protein KKD70_00715 [Patescibacteria group bacterium]|nr:hypothetical protein [Patescibacteria group bacterium]